MKSYLISPMLISKPSTTYSTGNPKNVSNKKALIMPTAFSPMSGPEWPHKKKKDLGKCLNFID